ncbi:sigma-70 family RNA polymerase sigma factor [Porticoccaceae bacterium LTM1]|nr:sigma-70 family RNA polymerase sigma factor [Porticoccaceae bacterium LTM1]
MVPNSALMVKKQDNVVDLQGRPLETREQALERLFHEHRSAVSAFLTVRLRVSREELDDVVQEVFARLARMEDLLEKLPPDNESARSYLFAAANRLVVDMERRRVVRMRYQQQLEQQVRAEKPAADSPESLVLAREDLEVVKAVLAGLKPLWRQAFILSRFKQKSYQEIADRMGVSIKTVEKYICMALSQLRKALMEGRGEE